MIVEYVVLAFVEDKTDRIVDPALGGRVMKLWAISFGECTLDFSRITLCEWNPTEEQENECSVKCCLIYIDTQVCQKIFGVHPFAFPDGLTKGTFNSPKVRLIEGSSAAGAILCTILTYSIP